MNWVTTRAQSEFNLPGLPLFSFHFLPTSLVYGFYSWGTVAGLALTPLVAEVHGMGAAVALHGTEPLKLQQCWET